MRPQPEKPPQACQRGGDADRSIVRAVVRDRPSSRRELDTRPDPVQMTHTLSALGSHDRQATSRGPLGFRYREALGLICPVAEIEAAARSLDQCEPCDEEKGGGP